MRNETRLDAALSAGWSGDHIHNPITPPREDVSIPGIAPGISLHSAVIEEWAAEFHCARLGSRRWLAWLPVGISLLLSLSLSTVWAQEPSAVVSPVREIHFSPDGRYLLVQDDAEITVLSAQSPNILFRIPARDVRDPQFTPDSGQIVFIRAVSHVERWSVTGKRRIALQDVPVIACGTERLSPDGLFLVCADPEGKLRLLEVGTGTTVVERQRYGVSSVRINTPDENDETLMDPSQARVDFSPDGRYFLAAPSRLTGSDDMVILRDLQNSRAVPDRRGLLLLTDGAAADHPPFQEAFAFVTPEKLLISLDFWAKHGVVTARLLAFPSGKEIGRPKLPMGPLFRAADPAYVIVRPFGPQPGGQREWNGHWIYRPPDPKVVPVNQRAAASEIATGQIIISETPALDVFHNQYVTESSPGKVGLYERRKGLQTTIALHEK